MGPAGDGPSAHPHHRPGLGHLPGFHCVYDADAWDTSVFSLACQDQPPRPPDHRVHQRTDLGLALGPGRATAVVSAGLRLGWEPAHSLGPSLIGLVSTLLLAPVFEEILYRERLFVWLRMNYAAPIALLLSSLAFALPHPGAFSKLAAFAAGLILGTARSLSGGLLPCIGLHAGLNVFGQLAAGAFYPAILQRDLGLIVAVPTLALSIFVSQTKRSKRR